MSIRLARIDFTQRLPSLLLDFKILVRGGSMKLGRNKWNYLAKCFLARDRSLPSVYILIRNGEHMQKSNKAHSLFRAMKGGVQMNSEAIRGLVPTV